MSDKKRSSIAYNVFKDDPTDKTKAICMYDESSDSDDGSVR